MPRPALSAAAAKRALQAIRELGQADRERLLILTDHLTDNGRARLGNVLGALFPGQERAKALAALRQLRMRLHAAAEAAGVALTLKADGKTRDEPSARRCWFAGDDRAIEAAEVQAEIASLGLPPPTMRYGVEPEESRTADTKRIVKYFVSYAHAYEADKDDLLARLKHRLGMSSAYRFEGWEDGDIVIGEPWHAQIQKAIADCTFGLLLVSPAFLSSGYIDKNELAHFVGPDARKPAIPVVLVPIRFDAMVDLKGLKEVQVFRDRKTRPICNAATSATARSSPSSCSGRS
jgi:hypothetical protein